MTFEAVPRLILASGSMARRQLLAATGLPFDVVPAAVDEAAVKREGMAEGIDAAALALRLAETKARHVSALHGAELVLAADQILALGTGMLDKPVGRNGLAEHLARLQGRSHDLVNGVILMRGGQVLWSYTDRVRMLMRSLDQETRDSYVRDAPDAVLQSVGGYRIEAEGIHLFAAIDGDSSSIQGLPLLPVLAALREEGLCWHPAPADGKPGKREDEGQ